MHAEGYDDTSRVTVHKGCNFRCLLRGRRFHAIPARGINLSPVFNDLREAEIRACLDLQGVAALDVRRNAGNMISRGDGFSPQRSRRTELEREKRDARARWKWNSGVINISTHGAGIVLPVQHEKLGSPSRSLSLLLSPLPPRLNFICHHSRRIP